jgi:DNA-directed RNA polymerase subunit E'/Rpb7
MLRISEITKNIILEPKHLNNNLEEYISCELKKKYDKMCCIDNGLIVSIEDIIELDNYINKDSIGITFIIKFKALTIKPDIGMKVSFIPFRIVESGIFGKIYEKINFFIPNKNLTDLSFVFNEEEQSYKNEKELITKETEIKVVIEEIKYDLLKYNCITSLIKLV